MSSEFVAPRDALAQAIYGDGETWLRTVDGSPNAASYAAADRVLALLTVTGAVLGEVRLCGKWTKWAEIVCVLPAGHEGECGGPFTVPKSPSRLPAPPRSLPDLVAATTLCQCEDCWTARSENRIPQRHKPITDGSTAVNLTDSEKGLIISAVMRQPDMEPLFTAVAKIKSAATVDAGELSDAIVTWLERNNWKDAHYGPMAKSLRRGLSELLDEHLGGVS